MIRTTGRQMLTCHHEAGHALVRWYFGHATDRAVVLTVNEVRAGRQVENRRGVLVPCEGLVDGYDICGYPHGPKGVTLDPATAPDFLARWAIERDVGLILCYAGFYSEAAYRRASIAGSMLDGGSGDMKGAAAILDAWNLTATERTAVAWAAERRASALVRSRMGATAIRAIASVLSDCGEIAGDHIAELCCTAYSGRACAFGGWTAHWPPSLAQIRAGHIPAAPIASQVAA